jgi:MFS family permease
MNGSPPTVPAGRIVALLCLAEVLSMTGFAAYPALLPSLRLDWAMSGTQAGFVGGAFFFGYMASVLWLTGMTDRVDARTVFATGCLLAAGGTVGFAWLADGVVGGAFCQALTGAGLAGTYMPGLKALTDRIDGPRQSRFIAFYTASFGIGTSLSLLAAGSLAAVLAWRWTFFVLALGPLLAAPVVRFGLRAQQPLRVHRSAWLPRFAAVLALGATRRYILGYACHCWELFGLRSWMVAFIVFAYGLHGAPSPALSATEAAAAINLLGLPASILGNEAAAKLGRMRWIAAIMLASGVLCWAVGWAATLPWWLMLAVLVLYFATVMADSAALTAGLVQATPLAQRGAAMAVYSLLGFGAGFLAPLLFGATLDAAGGGGNASAWTLAFGTLGVGGLLWAVATRGRAVR